MDHLGSCSCGFWGPFPCMLSHSTSRELLGFQLLPHPLFPVQLVSHRQNYSAVLTAPRTVRLLVSHTPLSKGTQESRTPTCTWMDQCLIFFLFSTFEYLPDEGSHLLMRNQVPSILWVCTVLSSDLENYIFIFLNIYVFKLDKYHICLHIAYLVVIHANLRPLMVPRLYFLFTN